MNSEIFLQIHIVAYSCRRIYQHNEDDFLYLFLPNLSWVAARDINM